MPPSSTGRASIPRAARIEAAIAGAGAALADRDDGPVGRGRRRRRRAAGGTGCCGCRRCSRRRARRARGRRSARRPPSSSSSSSSRLDRLDPLRAVAEHVALELEEADGAEASDRALRLVPRRDAWTTIGAVGIEQERRPSSRTRCPRRARSARRGRGRRGSARAGRTSSTVAPAGGIGSSTTSAAAPTSGPRFSSTSRVMFGGFGADTEAESATKSASCVDLERGVEAALEADRRGALRAHRLAAERPRDVAGEDLDAVRQLEQPPQRMEEAFGALLRADRQVGPGCVADEERVAGQDEPRLVGPRAVDHGEAGVLRTVPGRVDRAQHDVCRARPRRRPPADRARTPASAAGWIEIGTPCSSASRPWPERWSACVWVSIVRTIRTSRFAASASTGSIA